MGDDDDISEKSSARSSLADDVEAQPILKSLETAEMPAPLATEYRTNLSTKLIYLGAYFLLNLSLTLYNKALLNNFKFPWLLTGIHSSFAALGCFVLQQRGLFTLTELNTAEHIKLLAFSTLFTINIIIHRVFFARTYETKTYLSLLPLIAGVGLTTYGDYTFTFLGFACTLAGAILAAVKTVA